MPEVWTNKSFYSIGFYSYDNLAHHNMSLIFPITPPYFTHLQYSTWKIKLSISNHKITEHKSSDFKT